MLMTMTMMKTTTIRQTEYCNGITAIEVCVNNTKNTFINCYMRHRVRKEK